MPILDRGNAYSVHCEPIRFQNVFTSCNNLIAYHIICLIEISFSNRRCGLRDYIEVYMSKKLTTEDVNSVILLSVRDLGYRSLKEEGS